MVGDEAVVVGGWEVERSGVVGWGWREMGEGSDDRVIDREVGGFEGGGDRGWIWMPEDETVVDMRSGLSRAWGMGYWEGNRTMWHLQWSSLLRS